MTGPDQGRAAWDGWIEPAALLALVRNTAPFLYPLAPEPTGRLARWANSARGFLRILAAAELWTGEGWSADEQLIDYFALCLACHQATVATFVPTDVDSKIRGLVWQKTRDRDVLRALAEVAFAMGAWTVEGISQRAQYIGDLGAVSGHNGEWLSVMAGAHGRFLQVGDAEYAEKTAVAIDAELRRELQAFAVARATRGLELDVLRLAMSITHNLGDLDQGISFWKSEGTGESRARFARLAHENKAAYEGGFQPVAQLYRLYLASEGHRHYPLRAVKPLRQSADLLLPLGPFFDDWGGVVGTHPVLTLDDRGEVLDALVRGCRKVPGQQGYYRALAGFQERAPQVFEAAAAKMPAASRKELRQPEMRQLLAVPRASFEARARKVVQQLRP